MTFTSPSRIGASIPTPRAEPARRASFGLALFAATLILAAAVAPLPASAGPKPLRAEDSPLLGAVDSMNLSIVTVVGYPPSGTAGRNGAKPKRLIGTAVAISDDRLVTTASLAIPGGRVQVLLDHGNTTPAQLIGVDRRSNVALFKVEGGVLRSLRQGAPRSLATGAWVAVISNVAINRPQAALGRVVGRGDRIDAPYAGEIFEIDAPSYPGATGGAVLNEDGDWVAVVVGRAGTISSREGSGVGTVPGEEPPAPNHVLMALPAGQVAWIAKELEAYGGVRHGFLGVRLLRSASPESVGVFVADVVAGSPAESAGIRPGDRILAIDGQEVHAPDALTQLVRSGRPGDEIEVTLLRSGEIFAVQAVVGAAFVEPPIGPRPSAQGEVQRLKSELEQVERERRRLELRIRELELSRSRAARPGRPSSPPAPPVVACDPSWMGIEATIRPSSRPRCRRARSPRFRSSPSSLRRPAVRVPSRKARAGISPSSPISRPTLRSSCSSGPWWSATPSGSTTRRRTGSDSLVRTRRRRSAPRTSWSWDTAPRPARAARRSASTRRSRDETSRLGFETTSGSRGRRAESSGRRLGASSPM